MTIDKGDKALSFEQLVALAKNAGFPDDQLATAAAVAMGESSGYPTNRNSIGASGLWQILESAHGDLFSKYKGQWKNPINNADMAYSVWKGAGGSWQPWQAYTDGAYSQYLPQAQAATTKILQGGDNVVKSFISGFLSGFTGGILDTGKQAASDVTNAAGSIGSTLLAPFEAIAKDFEGLGKLFSALLIPATWVRIASGAFGTGFLVIAIYLLATSAKERSWK